MYYHQKDQHLILSYFQRKHEHHYYPSNTVPAPSAVYNVSITPSPSISSPESFTYLSTGKSRKTVSFQVFPLSVDLRITESSHPPKYATTTVSPCAAIA